MSNTLVSTASTPGRLSGAATLHVEVIADLACPFCYIGKRRLDTALDAVGGPSEITWYPYQLNPEMPADGMAFDAYLSRRFGSPASVQPALERLVAEGRREGIEFRFDRLGQVPNTLLAHQLMQLAGQRGVDQTRLAEDLMQAFFERGEDIGRRDVLLAIARRNGIPADAVEQSWADTNSRQIVLSREAQVRASGLSGVPGFLLNRRLLVVGAQPADALISAFDQAMFGEGEDELGAPLLN